jgi:hypothetical protein
VEPLPPELVSLPDANSIRVDLCQDPSIPSGEILTRKSDACANSSLPPLEGISVPLYEIIGEVRVLLARVSARKRLQEIVVLPVATSLLFPGSIPAKAERVLLPALALGLLGQRWRRFRKNSKGDTHREEGAITEESLSPVPHEVLSEGAGVQRLLLLAGGDGRAIVFIFKRVGLEILGVFTPLLPLLK